MRSIVESTMLGSNSGAKVSDRTIREAVGCDSEAVIWSPEKMRALVLYICGSTPAIDLFVIYQLLWRCDFMTFRYANASITGYTYLKQGLGVYPEGIDAVLDSILPDEKWDGENLLVHEVEVARKVIAQCAGLSRQALSDSTASIAGWDAARPGEAIPMGTALFSRPQFSSIEMAHLFESIDWLDSEI